MKYYLSPEGGEFIQQWEGCKLSSYLDTGDVWTVGYGHTEGVYPGMTISQEDATALLMEDVFPAESAVNQYVSVEINQHQVDALISFVFNVGVSAFKKSTLLKLLNQGDYLRAADELLRWCYDNGTKIQGLANRREAERALFLS
ncbi:Phage-related lysozyme (muraminidase) [Serratia quinivorans]|uniref:lysozyme n=1 Tax=Serratia quinivorans TaxID=137545 RepID=UPI00217C86AF|nr:lysozyme [Serratia quinivorans]CAI1566062.1 Phage-related lysozyme (muraminidase) [Serratia quinivorans]CAI1697176.1 Phage-related lysozyme (muraminidase) [Serratia quinivorans]